MASVIENVEGIAMSKKIRVVEACPRDGWEHQPFVIPTEKKMQYIKMMIDSGARVLDLVNFADPEKVPQMKDADEVMRRTQAYVENQHLNVECMGVAFDVKGLERALQAGTRFLHYSFSASDATNERMLHTTLEQSLSNMREILDKAEGAKMEIGLLCSFGSPFGDEVTLDRLKYICEKALTAGVSTISLCDTAGLGSPNHVRKIIEGLKGSVDLSRLSIHIHNAYGMGLANVFEAVEAGITSVEGSLGGIGTGPFAFIPGNYNLATEDIVNMLEAAGYDTGYDVKKLITAANVMCSETGAIHTSHLYDKRDCLLCHR
jgi:hydroxymethylglutaryl-CoA lyase